MLSVYSCLYLSGFELLAPFDVSAVNCSLQFCLRLRPAGARQDSQRDAGAVHGAPVGRRLARGRKCQRSRLVTHLNQGLKRS